MKRFFILTSALSMLWGGIMLLLNWTLTEWINYTFLFGLAAAIISACINIWQTRFLNMFTRGFRSLGRFIIPMNKSRSLERANQQLADDANLNQFKEKIAQVLFFSIGSLAASSIFVSIIGLIIYY
ncbi:DUF3899 domain-containing protein [Viridibacillus arvi]|uniref:DUF3899 domain-containing protein n=2 Tax=Viridibacillus arvi TaxID=263475 RepID=UPI0034CEAE35